MTFDDIMKSPRYKKMSQNTSKFSTPDAKSSVSYTTPPTHDICMNVQSNDTSLKGGGIVSPGSEVETQTSMQSISE